MVTEDDRSCLNDRGSRLDHFRIEVVCRDLVDSVQIARSRLQYSFDLEKVHQALWRVQDELARLVDCASDSPGSIFSFLRVKHPRLVREVIAVLELRLGLKRVHSRAIDQSCEEINRLLNELQRLKQTNAHKSLSDGPGVG